MGRLKRKRVGLPKPAYLYFIQVGDETGPIKIGYSTDVTDRIAKVQIGNPYEVRLLGKFKFETPEQAHSYEQKLHQRVFWDLRIRGEWFHCDPRILRLIREMQMTEEECGNTRNKTLRIKTIDDDGEDFR